MGRHVMTVTVAVSLTLAACSQAPQAAAPPTPEAALGTGAAPLDGAQQTTATPTGDGASVSLGQRDRGESEDPAAVTQPDPTLPIGEPPAMPEVARERTAEGAEAFAQHYLDALNWAFQTQYVGYVTSLGAPSCATCDGLTDGARAMRRPTGLVRQIDLTATMSDDGAVVNVSVERLESTGPQPGTMRLRLGWSGVWLVEEVILAD